MLLSAAMAALAMAGSPVCEDARLACPNLVMRRPYDLRLLKGRYLASTNAIVNVGDGPAEIRARRATGYRMTFRQVIRPRQAGGTPRVLEGTGGSVVFHDTKTRGVYWKLQDAARFELWTIDEDGTLGRKARTGPKLIYCLRDLSRLTSLTTGRPYPRSPLTRQFPACSQDPRERERTLGTSVGWADVYPWSYPQNWISVRGLSGCFAYVHRADPEGHLAEIREDDNAAATVVRLPFRPRNGKIDAGCPKLSEDVNAGTAPAAAPDEPQGY